MNTNSYILSLLHSDMVQIVEIFSYGRQGPTYLSYVVNIMAAYVLVTQGPRSSTAIVLT